MKKIKMLTCLLLMLVLCISLTAPAFADGSVTYNNVVDPVVKLINSLLKPVISIVVAVGSLYCVILGVKYAKAEEPQDREKAKQHLKNAIVGFVLIFILILALNVLKDPLIDWVNRNATKMVIT